MHPGYVYAIGRADGEGPIKIGWTRGLAGRLRDLQIGNPHDLIILGCCEGGRDVEQNFHRSLAKYRVRGEWFDISWSALANDLPQAPEALVFQGLALDQTAWLSDI